ncbi:hypothetical protein [Microbacterium foliorum]|uniref:hypothetical protein n=1 Tax=Microbacterium foliorum TaxID=104336 RepID=UPI0028D69338|nr:hypothetical protein [Microbacterium foliorum]
MRRSRRDREAAVATAEAKAEAEAAAERAESEKLSLVSAEVDRHLADVATRQSNAITRASIILAAAGVSVFATVDPRQDLWMTALPTGLSFAAALVSLAGLRYWKSDAAQSSLARVQALMAATVVNAQWSLLNDKHKELFAARRDLKWKSRFVRWSTVLLVAAWMSVIAIKFGVDLLLLGSDYREVRVL